MISNKSSTDRVEHLIRDHRHLAVIAVRRLLRKQSLTPFSYWCDEAEMLSQAYRILWWAACRYDPSRPAMQRASFSTFALNCLNRALWQRLRDARRDSGVAPRFVSLSSPLYGTEGGDLEEIIADPAQTVDAEAELERREMAAELWSTVARLPDRQRTILTAYHRDEETFQEIGERLGISRQRVHQIYCQALSTLRETLPRIDH